MNEDEARAALIELLNSYGFDPRAEWLERHPSPEPHELGFWAYTMAPPPLTNTLRVAWTK